MARRIKLLAIASALVVASASPANAAVTANNPNGSSISIKQKTFSKPTQITVTGRGFDETVGIYLALCVVPKKGQLPTPCGGGVNKDGVGESSYWISSNPPPYGQALAIEYLPGGRFSQQVSITKRIGKFDCRKVKCAITVRADHTRESDRSRDIFIPITFK
ncbi:MAG: hypothetical protein F2602_02385 [Actinobacteria bacterium]|nr:hypothetical protein [Actinomycetota bacterium]MTA21257.1 hypothetical protein [Actinomycetota bacterium]